MKIKSPSSQSFEEYKALLLAEKLHQGQVRKYTGEPFINHPRAVYFLAKSYNLSSEACIAAILHDTVEDTGYTLEAIFAEFGPRVAWLVHALTDLQTPSNGNRATRKRRYADWLGRIPCLEAHSLKLLDLLHNAQSIRSHDPKFWKVYLEEAFYLIEQLRYADKNIRQRLLQVLS